MKWNNKKAKSFSFVNCNLVLKTDASRMGKRQIRILGQNCYDRISEFVGKGGNFVLKNNTVLAGLIENEEGEDVILIDYSKKKHVVSKNDMIEVIIDREAAY